MRNAVTVAARAISLALIAMTLAACASSNPPQQLTRRQQADLERVIPMTGMP